MLLERVYLSQAEPALDHWERSAKIAPDFGGFLLTLKAETDAEIATAVAFKKKCEAAGLVCIIGFRYAETFTHPANWCEKAFWLASAKTLDKLSAAGISELHTDGEAYGLTAGKLPSAGALAQVNRTVANLRSAMEPFLASLAKMQRVMVYPAVLEDEVIAAIYDTVVANGKSIELWVERFGLAEQIMRDPHKAEHVALEMARNRARLSRKFPAALVRDGDYDWLMRAVGNEARRNWRDSYGPLDPWVFLLHQHSDETRIGSIEWYEGVALGKGNRVLHAWAFSGATTAFKVVSMSDLMPVPLRASSAPELPVSNIINTNGYRLSDRRYLRMTRALPVMPYTITFDGVVPYTSKAVAHSDWAPVLGESQPNADSWAIVASEGVLYLRTSPILGAERVYHPLVNFSSGRFAITRTVDGQFIFTPPGGGPEITVEPKPVRAGGGHLYIGAAAVPNVTNALLTTEGLVVGRVEIHGLTTAEERAAIVASAYPRD